MKIRARSCGRGSKSFLPIAFVAIAATCASQLTRAQAKETSHDPLRGVAPEHHHLYATPADGGTEWKCLESGETIPFSAVNDDYCDCKDGSDEPGTSACPTSRFYCKNEGHLPAYLLSSRVNDGICDPECCDGSDETDGKVSCPDRCAKIGKEYRKRVAEQQNIQRAGAKIRAGYIAQVKKSLEATDLEVTKLEVEVQVAEEKEQRLKAALEIAEQADAGVIERKKASPLYATLRTHQNALAALQDRDALLKAEIQRLTALLDDLSSGYNPNYQDMAVKGVVMEYRKWRRGSGDAATEGAEGDAAAEEQNVKEDTEPVRLYELLYEGDWTQAVVRDLAQAETLGLMDDGAYAGSSESETGILFRIHEYLPDPVVPYFEAGVDTLLDLLTKANVISDVKRTRKSGDEAEPENVVAARAAYNTASSDLESKRSSLATKRGELNLNPEQWGRESEWKALDQKCISKNMGEYTYEFCFFGNTKQVPNKGGMSVGLGRFNRFEPVNTSLTVSDDAFFHRQMYDKGQRCWNGPERSSIVEFTCGTENELLDVFEAEKCIYKMKVSTPAICLPLEERHANAKPKDEL
ncbi:hypothetical protein IE81DRAFT_319256 [Ceraceosorus guamensis]|uniref:Glucosidase 2 subunit beta n=1 Tax=Ceraceosorus guamensis TaxID=1522189 RepID=A0A316W8V1_9BASI|nr:hypothetical protein IE81DRAFT_319256 [Ceraceosorus guamensis]PWN46350.1 hypothetical protein IE81DRAFT_319256 [Ceraceosorus guamensis]